MIDKMFNNIGYTLLVILVACFSVGIGFISADSGNFSWQNTILIFTALIIGLYTWETRRLKEISLEQAAIMKSSVEEGIRPFVEVQLISISGKSHLRFFRLNKIPAKIKVKILVDDDKKDTIKDGYLNGKEFWNIIGTQYISRQPELDKLIEDYKASRKDLKATLYVDAMPRFLAEGEPSPSYNKEYRFDVEADAWGETHWGDEYKNMTP